MTAVFHENHKPSAKSSRLRWLLLALVGLALIALGVYGPRGWSAYQDSKLRRMTETELESLVRRQPTNLDAQYRLGLAYARANRYPAATKAFLAVLEKEPTRADVLNDLGVAYLLQERYYESLVALQGALESKPDFAAAWANMGRLHLATKMPFTATKELEKAVSLEPDKFTLCDLGEAYQKTLNQKSAEAVYRRALASDSRHVPASVGLGKTCYSEGKYDEAIQALKEALKLAPDSAAARFTLARIQLEKAQTDADLLAGRDLIQQGLKTEPDNPDAWYDLGRISLRLNKPSEALEPLIQALRLSPGHNGALLQLEHALRAVGRTADADHTVKVLKERSLREREETRLEEHIEHNPGDWDAQAQLAESYVRSGKRGLALLLYSKLTRAAPQNPRLPALGQALNRQAAPPPSPAKEP